MSDTERPQAGPWGSEPQPKIADRCPTCGAESLFIGTGGWLTCAVLRCKNPGVGDAIEKLKAAQGRFYELEQEIEKARECHGPMHGPHEGYAVILEELDELWEEVRARHHDKDSMRKEALQVAAMALRFIADVCDAVEQRDETSASA